MSFWVDEIPVDINECLSVPCLSEVFRFLPFKERVKSERVCKLWQKIIVEVNATKQSSLTILGEMITVNVIANFCTHPNHRNWKCTDIIERSDWMTDILSVLRKVPNLKALHLRSDDYNPILLEGESVHIGKMLPKLEHFSLIDDFMGVTILNDTLGLISAMPNVFHLELRFPVKEGSSKLEMLQENTIITEALELFKGHIEILSTNVPLNPDNCRTLSSQCNKMRKLSLVGTTLPVPGLNSFLNEGGVRGKYLRCLSIVVDCEEQLQLICNQMICLQSFHCVVNVKNLKNIGAIGKLRNLKNLFLSAWANDLLDEGLLKVFLGCNKLSSLIVNGDVSDKSFKLISGFCDFIKRVEINNGNKQGDLITDESLMAFTKLEFLYSLNLYYCDVSDDAVKTLLDNCKDLQYLRLTCCKRLTKDILQSCIDFAKEKPTERITFVFPDRLKRYWEGFIHKAIPKNIVMQWL